MPRGFAVASFLTLACAGAARAQFNEGVTLPKDYSTIEYSTAPTHDRVAQFIERLAKGDVKLNYDPQFGYLPAILHAFNVPLSSQILVFSKTSFQAARISPRAPRAVYHTDDVGVGYVQSGDVLELAAVDPRQGVIFYTVDQNSPSRPQIARSDECYLCHITTDTLGVPGLVVRSVLVSPNGYALKVGDYITDYRSPLEHRWGGWYVTGTHGAQLHMGNQVLEDRDDPHLDLAKGANVTDLSKFIDTKQYLRPSSDIVSLMVLEHQTRTTNLITRLGWETRMGKSDAATAPTVEELVRSLLFAGEAPLTARIAGNSGYAAEFSKLGVRDHQGRSLRDFDLEHRLFRYPCSFLIYSAQFDGLPPAAQARVYRRMWEVLTRGDPRYNLTPADRQAIVEILHDTKPGLPDYWR